MREIATAQAEVQAVIGRPVMACDSASAVYMAGLRALNYIGQLHPSAARSMFRALKYTPKRTTLAMDAKSSASMAADLKRFPGAAALKNR
jgi:hypothetical protein